jgi:tripartite-type tricarboxylate transporter receptor subunit TctC
VALTRRDLNRLGLGLAAAPFGAFDASAEDYPSRPVHLIVPYAGGGSGDLLARLLGEQLSKLWGQQVVIETNPAPAD